MKFRVDRDVLGEAVAWVARELPTRPVVPVLSGLLMQARTDRLTLSCFDYEVSARVELPAEIGEPGTALVPGRLLADITRSLPPDDVEFTTATGLVVLTCGSAEFALVSLPLEEYPKLPELPAVAGTVDGGVLASAASQVVPSSSRDDTLPMLTGVNIDFDGRALTLAATDRYRLAVRTVPWMPVDPTIRASALVPARTLADVARTMGPGKPVTIAFGHADPDSARPADGIISFEGGGRRLTARLIGTDFIRYESRFPASFEARAELPAAPFTEAVRRVSLVADRATPVQLAFRPDVVVVEAQSDGRARGVESVPMHFTGTSQVISFNPHYLLDGLTAAALCGQAPGGQAPGGEAGQQIPGAGRIRLDFTSPAKPALITWIDGDAAADGGETGPVTDAADSGGNGGAGRDPVADSARGHERTPGPAAQAIPFRYLVVPLRAPAAG